MAAWDRVFWRATAERCVGTLAATGIVLFTAESAEKLAGTDWIQAGWLTLAATGVTFCKCILANLTPGSTGPGFGRAEVLEEKK